MNIKLENKITIDEYNNLRKSINWNILDSNTVKHSIENSFIIKKAILENEVVGMARIISDGIYAFIVDVIVNENYQGKGIGKILMSSCLKN